MVRPSTVNERGPDGSVHGSGAGSRIDRLGGRGRHGMQYSTRGGTVARGLLDPQGGAEPSLLPALAGQGGGSRAHPGARTGRPGGQSPVVLRLVLPPP